MSLALDREQCAALERRLRVAIEARDTATVRDVLVQLCGADAKGCLQAIAKTDLGKTRGKTVWKLLSKHPDAQLAQAATEVCAYWEALISSPCAQIGSARRTRLLERVEKAKAECAFWKETLSRKEETAAEGLLRGGGLPPGFLARYPADALALVLNRMSPPPLQPQQPMPKGDFQTFTWPAGVVPGQVYTCTHRGHNFDVAAPRDAQAGAQFAVTVPVDAPDPRVRDIARFQRVCPAFRDAAKLVLAQEEAEAKKQAKREVESRAKVEENERTELAMTDTIKELVVDLFDARPAHVTPEAWLTPDPRAFPGKAIAGDLLGAVGLLRHWRDQYPECAEIIFGLLAALQYYNDRTGPLKEQCVYYYR